MPDWLNNPFVLFLSLSCCVTIIAIVVVAFLGLRWMASLFATDMSKIQAVYEERRAKNPNLSRDQLIEKIIHEQAVKCGIIGGITGLGGIFTLPLALPIDLVTTLRIQSEMVQFIAAAYGQTKVTESEAKIREYVVIAGTGQIADRVIGSTMNMVLRVAGKSLSKFIPFFGAILSFGVNYAIARGTGQVAKRWYSRGIS